MTNIFRRQLDRMFNPLPALDAHAQVEQWRNGKGAPITRAWIEAENERLTEENRRLHDQVTELERDVAFYKSLV